MGRRERHRAAHPVHVTMRLREGLPSMREPVLFRELRRRIADANRSPKLRDVFRVVHFSVQDNHVHMIVEAHDPSALSRGVLERDVDERVDPHKLEQPASFNVSASCRSLVKIAGERLEIFVSSSLRLY